MTHLGAPGPGRFEEPVYPVDDYDAMARIRGETGVTVAAGENIGNAAEARRAIELGALDIFQPSVTKIGGIAAMREAIAIARQHGVRVMPHSPYFGPGLIATLHVIAACLPDSMCERFYCEDSFALLTASAALHYETTR